MKTEEKKRGAGRPQDLAHRSSAVLLLCLALATGAPAAVSEAPALVPAAAMGVSLARDFRISLYAGPELVGEATAMALDAQGRVVVAGPGFIKVLLDTDQKGRAGQTAMLGTPADVSGLCFDGSALFCSGGGWVSRYESLQDGVLSRHPPVNLFAIGAQTQNARAIHQGADGRFYLVVGNVTAQPKTRPGAGETSHETEGGVLLAFAGGGEAPAVWARGFNNPAGFTFDLAGEVFAFDVGSEKEVRLPWHARSRLLHVTWGGHYGWKGMPNGEGRLRPDYYPDVNEGLLPMEPGIGAGLVCYRHKQFPARYRGGLFALDWAAGKIYCATLEPQGGSYRAQAEVFLQAILPHGFSPMSAAVGMDGSLFVCSGGQGLPTAVYRIDYVGPPLLEPTLAPTASQELNQVLLAPQPLEAWSRARWLPEAQQIGLAPFARVIVDEEIAPIWRVRAIEIATEVLGGLPPAQAEAAAHSSSPMVRARAAWSLGCIPGPNPSLALFPLLSDPEPWPRRCALESTTRLMTLLDSPELVRLLLPSLGSPDKPVRLAAARAASVLSPASWDQLVQTVAEGDPGARLTVLEALVWRGSGADCPEALEPLATVLEQTRNPMLRRDALRLIMLALGDWKTPSNAPSLFYGFEAAAVPKDGGAVMERIMASTRALLPSGNEELQLEATRLLAMLQDQDVRVTRALLDSITPRSLAEHDFHGLTCLARRKAWPAALTPLVAESLLTLNAKFEERGWHPEQQWPERLAELAQALLRHDPRLAEVLARSPRLVVPGRLALAKALGREHQPAIARAYSTALREQPGFPWSGPLLELLSSLAASEVKPLLRGQWNNLALRDDLLAQLAARPEVADVERFWEGLDSARPDTQGACLSALLALPAHQAGTNLAACLGLLERLVEEPKEADLRRKLTRLISQQTGQGFEIIEPTAPAKPTLTHSAHVKSAYAPVFSWFLTNRPTLGKRVEPRGGDDPEVWLATVKSAPWTEGNPARGARLFHERGCASCHSGPKACGPPLDGLAARRSPDEIFDAIVFPSHEVTDRYRATAFLLRDGRTITGLTIHDSAAVLLVRTSPDALTRVSGAEVAARQPARFSPMPSGRLEGASPESLADLFAFLRKTSVR